MKRVTTSAQKTVRVEKADALRRLTEALTTQEGVSFAPTRNPDVLVADFHDGSKLYAASFDKDDHRALAMIDHKNVLESTRTRWQRHWRQSLDSIF